MITTVTHQFFFQINYYCIPTMLIPLITWQLAGTNVLILYYHKKLDVLLILVHAL